MKSKNLPIIILSVVIILGVFIFALSRSKKEPEPEPLLVEEQEVVVEKEDTDEFEIDAPEGAITYKITEGTASYTAQKRFLEKDDAVVVGTTTEIVGGGWFHSETGNAYLEASMDLTGLTSDSAQRDSDVQKMITDKVGKVSMQIEGSELEFGEPLEMTIPLTVKVMGLTREIEFNVSAVVTEEEFTAEGTAQALISDFGLTPPSLLNVFTVDDEIELSFAVEGTVVASDLTTEETEESTATE